MSNRKSGGFSLMEVMAATAIFAITVVAFLQILMGVHRTNAALAAAMTANSAIRSQADEALAAAAANAAAHGGNFARGFVQYYGVKVAAMHPSGDTLPIGPNGTGVRRVELDGGGSVLVYRFAVPEPGAFGLLAAAGREPYPKGVGEMRMYLDEAAMPVGSAGGGARVWETGGDRNGDDGDGVPAAPGGGVDVRDPPAGLNRVFADITVTYFQDAAHTRTLSVNQRRILVVGSMDIRDLFG